MMRTFAMSVVGAAYAVIAVIFLIFAAQPFAVDFLVVIVAFVAVFAVVGLAAVAWTGARTRPWFWLAAAVLGLLVLLFNGFYAPYALTHPADALTFVTTLGVVAAGALAIVGSLTAWREVRAGRPVWHARGRAGLVMAGVVGLILGASVTSVFAAASMGAGPAGIEPPATTATLLARDTAFVGQLEATSGEVLGILVTNVDPYAHSFDVDALAIHVPLPPGSTTFVALKPTAGGTIPFYCGVPGHKDAGMVGTITVP
jgi:hypothetical protein